MILSAAFALTGRCSASPFSGSRQTRRLPALRSYDFANAGDMRVPGQRRNRNVEKRKGMVRAAGLRQNSHAILGLSTTLCACC